MTARQRSGYYVEQLSALQPAEPQPRVPAKPEAPEPPAKPSAALFPFSVWAKLMRGVILDEGEALLRPMPGAGLSALRRAICDDLLRRRGMHVEPRQVYIGAGAEYFYHLLLEFFGRDRVYGLETLGHRKIARMFGLSETLIGLTIVAIGTSLPELVTSIVAARKGQNEIAMGNVIGSNLFNILLILGVSAVITPIPVQATSIIDCLFLIAISVVFYLPARKGKLGRLPGAVMAAMYVAYTAYLIMR